MKNAVIFGMLFAVTGCSTAVTPVATGGSKADGVVEMSYEYGTYSTPVVDEAAGMREAIARCKTWGFDDAKAFAGVTACSIPSGMGCGRYRVTMEYQCTVAE